PRTIGVTPPDGPISIRPPPMSLRGRDLTPASASDDTEQIVHRAWRRLLGVPRVPSGASFFDLGGDSLLAVQLLAELRVKTGADLKMRQFAAQPTVEGMVALLRPQAEPAPKSSVPKTLRPPPSLLVPPNSQAPKTIRPPSVLVSNDAGAGPLSVRS